MSTFIGVNYDVKDFDTVPVEESIKPMDYLPPSSLTKDEQELIETLENCTVIHQVNMERFSKTVMPTINGLVHQSFARELQSLFNRNDNSAPRLYEWAARIAQEQWMPSSAELFEAAKLSAEMSITASRVYLLYKKHWEIIHNAKFNMPDQTTVMVKVEKSLIDFRTHIKNFPHLEYAPIEMQHS